MKSYLNGKRETFCDKCWTIIGKNKIAEAGRDFCSDKCAKEFVWPKKAEPEKVE